MKFIAAKSVWFAAVLTKSSLHGVVSSPERSQYLHGTDIFNSFIYYHFISRAAIIRRFHLLNTVCAYLLLYDIVTENVLE